MIQHTTLEENITPLTPRKQFAALPYRRVGAAEAKSGDAKSGKGAKAKGGDELEIMLISSRETRRWVLPKGWPMKGRKPHMVAAIEALEEAGLEGKVSKKSVGAYRYIKRMRNGAGLLCEVGVFPLRVAKQRKKWRERGQRVTKWFSPVAAAELVHEPELQELILNFAAAAPIAPKDEESLAPEPATPLERSE